MVSASVRQCVSALVRCLVGYEGWECGQNIFWARSLGARVIYGLHGSTVCCLDPSTRAMHRGQDARSRHRVGPPLRGGNSRRHATDIGTRLADLERKDANSMRNMSKKWSHEALYASPTQPGARGSY